jgi:predicted RNA binding protein YcfA (HicA-like mRNA interferase family)
MRPMSKQQLVKLLKRNGAQLIRQDGDHEVWRVGDCQTYVPKQDSIGGSLSEHS